MSQNASKPCKENFAVCYESFFMPDKHNFPLIEKPLRSSAAQIGFPFVDRNAECAGKNMFARFKIACRLFAALRTACITGAALSVVWPCCNFVCAAQRGSLFSFESRCCENIFNCDASLCQNCRSARCLCEFAPTAGCKVAKVSCRPKWPCPIGEITVQLLTRTLIRTDSYVAKKILYHFLL